MSKLNLFLTSSVGKKVLMSLTGLFLCTFLVVHVSGNLLLFKNDGGEAFEVYSKFMSSNIFIRATEIGLFAGFALHIYTGLYLSYLNWKSRPINYKKYKLSQNTTFESRIIRITAIFILLFLIIHLRTFWFESRFLSSTPMYELVKISFQNIYYTGFYVAAMVMLAFHLKHGFQSAFQTLGIRNLNYLKLLNFIAFIFWFVIPIIFATMPVYFFINK